MQRPRGGEAPAFARGWRTVRLLAGLTPLVALLVVLLAVLAAVVVGVSKTLAEGNRVSLAWFERISPGLDTPALDGVTCLPIEPDEYSTGAGCTIQDIAPFRAITVQWTSAGIITGWWAVPTELAVGELIAAWGRPDEVTQNGQREGEQVFSLIWRRRYFASAACAHRFSIRCRTLFFQPYARR